MGRTWWHEGELAVQRRAGVTNHDKLRNGVRDELPPHFRDFLTVQRFVVLATSDAHERLWCSMVAGWPWATVKIQVSPMRTVSGLAAAGADSRSNDKASGFRLIPRR